MVDPNDRIFWDRVKECIAFVEANHGLNFDIEIGNRRAYIYWYSSNKFNVINAEHVRIELYEIEPKQPALQAE